MGCGGSKDAGEQDTSVEDAASKALEAELDQQQKEEDAITKLLVLGTGESGKSTVFKQMKILYAVPDPPAKFIQVCRANLFGNVHAVVGGMKTLNIKYGGPEGEAAGEKLTALPADGNLAGDAPADLEAVFATMYKDSGVDEAIERAAEYQLNDSTRYFWERAPEILKADYMPTEQDVLRARVRTTGIVQQNFQIGERKYTMFDVGGQRNERRKWIHCFDNVTAVIFVTAISEYDQVLYEDASTNRMDEAVTLFDQICNHNSFIKTSMILFLNKRDLFAMKLEKDKRDHPLTAWDPEATTGKDYDACIRYIIQKFVKLNKDPVNRQVYCHATCATDTSNVSFVMDSVFDVVLKDNLRRMQKADLSKMLDAGGGTGKSGVKTGPDVWKPTGADKVLLVAAYYTDNLSERKVLTMDGALSDLPAVEVCGGQVMPEDFMWLMELGKDIPVINPVKSEIGSFKGNFKEACGKMRELLGLGPEGALGFLYDQPVRYESSKLTLLVCVKCCPASDMSGPWGLGFKGTWVTHEDMENPHYKKYAGVTETVGPPDKNAEFNPFAANPVGFRWFKGVTLFTANVSKIPDKGVYLGIFKVVSTPTGFKIMVNEHNRIMIPIIFLTENQLSDDEKTWMHGVRIREGFGIDLLEGGKPNMGWLGPEMSGEEGATFKEKLAWAVGEAKSRLDIADKDPLGFYYDAELLQVDEKSNMQILCYGSLAQAEADVLAGHIWVERAMLEVQNMKYYCPTVLQALLNEQQGMVKEYLGLDDGGALSPEDVINLRKQREEIKTKLNAAVNKVTPLKWVNRMIMWCADKMPSFGEALVTEGLKTNPIVLQLKKDGTPKKPATPDVKACIEANAAIAKSTVDKAIFGNMAIEQTSTARQQLLQQYYKP